MSHIQLGAYCNTDDTFLVWKADVLEGCLGFAIERIWLHSDQPGRVLNRAEYLVNRVGFAGDAAAGPNQRRPSNVWPYQRYNWTDHELAFKDRARYRVLPMVGTPGALEAKEEWASEWVDVAAVQPGHGKLSCFFNRPMAASPWMARMVAEQGIHSSTELVETIADVSSKALRNFCGGTLIVALRRLFDHADHHPDVHLYAALFELEDEEVVRRFCKLGGRAHIVLSNGNAKESEPDANAVGRALVREAGCEVVDRMTSLPGQVGDLGHNKFIVVVDGDQPLRVWSGSTNLTPTGLFTQINNALLVESGELAGQYLEQWQRLADAGSGLPSTLKKSNAAPGAGTDSPARIEPWFTPTVKQGDLKRLQALVEGAREGILFLSFMPGPNGPVLDVLEERAGGTYVRGVLNQFVGGAKGKLMAALVGGSAADPMDLDVFKPSGIKQQFAFWAAEFMRGGKISVLVHSKVLCIDPFGDHPVVVTGSHNFSSLASESNDENFLIVEGDPALAQAYATHIMSVYNHYRWRQYVAATLADNGTPWQKLDAEPSWQQSRVASARQRDEWRFWL
jgi:hypothetical protein